MPDSIVLEIVKQGGFAALCAGLVWLYRHDSVGWAQKQHETAQAYMAFGERTAASLTSVSEAMRQQSGVLQQIERHLAANHLCPVTQVTSEMLRGVEEAEGPQRRRVDALLREALRRAASEVVTALPHEGV